MPLAISFGRRGWPISLRKSRMSNARSRPRARRLMVSSVISVVPFKVPGVYPEGRLRGQASLLQDFAVCRSEACPRRIHCGSGLFLVRDAINLDLAIDHHVRLHGGPGWGGFAFEVLGKHLVETPQVPRV